DKSQGQRRLRSITTAVKSNSNNVSFGNGNGPRTGRMAQPEWEERKPITVDKLEKYTAVIPVIWWKESGFRREIYGGYVVSITIHVPPPESLTQRFIKSNTGNFTASPSLKGYVGDTHLVKGLDYGLLNKVRNEIVKKRETPQDDPTPRRPQRKAARIILTAYGKGHPPVASRPVSSPLSSRHQQRQQNFNLYNSMLLVVRFAYLVQINSFMLQAVYQWIIKPQTTAEQNDMFLPERMAFLKNMWYSNVFDIRDDPTTHILNIIIMPGSIKKHGVGNVSPQHQITVHPVASADRINFATQAHVAKSLPGNRSGRRNQSGACV
ncbi:suppressor of mec-8 and unc-52 protein homolog 2, partial [Tanacetum coccineum]